MRNKMESRGEIARSKHLSGYNCCQAVVCTYCDVLGIDEETAFKLAEGFGVGMGSGKGICGAVSGAVMVAGMKNSEGTSNKKTKGATMKLASSIVNKFEQMNGTAICNELKGKDTGNVIRTCPDCVQDAIKIVEEIVMNDK
ncbi:MAG: C-GCAxxG-C-C family protein [Eubacteriales bacterium]|nr:C-GCAxxG-C-C family protein [Eubacteriales bacterium]